MESIQSENFSPIGFPHKKAHFDWTHEFQKMFIGKWTALPFPRLNIKI